MAANRDIWLGVLRAGRTGQHYGGFTTMNDDQTHEQSDNKLLLILGSLMTGFIVGLGIASVIDGWILPAAASAVGGIIIGSCFVLSKPKYKAWSAKMNIVADELKAQRQAKAYEREKQNALRRQEMESPQFSDCLEPTDRQIALPLAWELKIPNLTTAINFPNKLTSL